MKKYQFKPFVIIGAPRSGTNMLRDLICQQDGLTTWPCDEINYIWRYGHANWNDDEFTSEMATSKIQNYIRKQFEKISTRYQSSLVVEKTCANSLRIEFVQKIFPEAIYLYIVRNGLDVVPSAMLRWKAKIDVAYLARKARFVPIRDLPLYVRKYIQSHIHRILSSTENCLSIWGPKIKNYQSEFKNLSLMEICAKQWQRCIFKSNHSFLNGIDSRKVYRLKYENLVASPVEELKDIFKYFSLPYNESKLIKDCTGVTDKNVGKGKKMLGESQRDRLHVLLQPTLKELGY